MKSVKRKYIKSTYLRNVQEYEYNLVKDKKIILYYFDITLKNGYDNELKSPYYEDLFIDVILKDGKISILDEDELNEALEKIYY